LYRVLIGQFMRIQVFYAIEGVINEFLEINIIFLIQFGFIIHEHSMYQHIYKRFTMHQINRNRFLNETRTRKEL